ncbi:MAG: DnaK suppressor protein [Solirubrobacteraceae bacterium]|jgi:DnaK suppressor protein|nr:DnaK suppressor protein [Solirubrobacteraceae bacterium]
MDEARARELLATERARIERALAEIERPAQDEELSHVDQHLADAGTELFETERDAGLAAQLREELAAVERAEQRLAAGTYGRSVESGEPIPDERLEAMPTAERTVEEQARYGG